MLDFIHKETIMAKFLNTSATTYLLEELIKDARERLYLISPFLKLNDKVKELLEDKDRLKIDVRIVYGKTELHPSEINWLKQLEYVRTSYCHNLHAKCYISEKACIITSLNLYDFSQINNNEMGVYLTREDDNPIYNDAYEEAQRIIRISEEVKISLDIIPRNDSHSPNESSLNYLTAAKLGEKYNIDTRTINQKLSELGLQEWKGKSYFLTEKGKEQGAQLKKGAYGWFILWPETLELS